MIDRIRWRLVGALLSFGCCRRFGKSWPASLYRAARYLLTGRTGRYPINPWETR